MYGKYTLAVSLDSAAMEDASQLAELLREQADRLEDWGLEGYRQTMSLKDINGNRVGSAKVTWSDTRDQ